MKDKYYKNAYDSLSVEQKEFIKNNCAHMTRKEICNKLCIPESRLRRAASFIGWKFTYSSGFAKRKYDDVTIENVLNYYYTNGRPKTAKKFPLINVRSIIEKYQISGKRCKKWTYQQKIELLKMAGIINFVDQAIYFNRPLANKGSIVSIWQKFFKCSARNVNGLPKWKAQLFVKKSCPYIETTLGNKVRIYLWVDCENNLKDECPDFIRDAIKAMALFQRKIFKNPRKEIEEILTKMGKFR